MVWGKGDETVKFFTHSTPGEQRGGSFLASACNLQKPLIMKFQLDDVESEISTVPKW